MSENPAPLWDIKKVQRYFGIKRATVYLWMKQGKLPKPVKRWGSPRWDPAEIEKMLKGGDGG